MKILFRSGDTRATVREIEFNTDILRKTVIFIILVFVLLLLFYYSQNYLFNLYINLACLSVSLFVCFYPINVKTAEPIGPKFFVGHHVTPGKVYG